MRSFGLSVAVLALACSPSHEERAPSALQQIASTRAFGELTRALPLERTGSIFRARGALVVEAPARSAGTTHLAVRDDQWIDLRPRDVRDVSAVPSSRTLVYPSAIEHGDLVVFASDNAFEELRVVRAGDRHVARYELTTGPAIAEVRVRDGRIEALDESGRVAIGSAPAFLVDAAGVRRDVAATITRETQHTFSIAFDAPLDGLAFPVVIDPAWSTVPTMKAARVYHGAVRLADGKVLVFGGQTTGSTVLSSAERYDPVANTWTDVGNLPVALAEANAVLLKSGKVLATKDANVALYDPASATWATGPSPIGGYADSPLLLDDGRVLGIARGGPNNAVSWSEPSGAWTFQASPPVNGLREFSTIKLADGRVLLVGGTDTYTKIYATVQIYNPTTDTWSATGSMIDRRAGAKLARLPSGNVLAFGGRGAAGSLTTSEIYDRATGKWSPGPPLPSGRSSVSSITQLADGPVLILTDGVAYTWAEGLTSLLEMGSQPADRPIIAQTVALSNGALVTGGFVTGPLSTVSRLTLSSQGSTCSSSSPGDCASGHCVDGVCCGSACEGPCQQCNATGTAGTCTNMSGAPHAGRSCAPYAACVAGACASGCTADTDCASSSYCVGTACVAKKTNGVACSAARECASGSCVDGVCCNTACGGQCEACDLPTSLGTCAAVTGIPRGGRSACGGSGECGQVCDGATRSSCVYLPPGSTPCGRNACSGGIETHASTCNGMGACADVPKSCAAYVCGAVTCKTACGGKADCAAGFICALGACVPAPGLGEACTTGAACSTGFCVDGVCCGSASCGAGSTCASKAAPGQCRKTLGVACAMSNECDSEKCVDGVCCDSACDGQCEACTVAGSVGKCVAAKGAPRGSRAACATDTSSPCASRTCDGVERASCVAFAPKETSCRASSCKDGVATTAATCDGAGACPAPVTVPCGAYACDAEGSACRTRCSEPSHCSSGNTCLDGVCVPEAATCSSDGLARFGADGTVTSCAPFLCKGGECATACGTTLDCAPGLVCADTRCVEPQTSDDGGGCTMSHASSPRAAWLVLAAVLAVAVARRRRTLATLSAITVVGCSPGRVEERVAATSQPIALSPGEETLYPHARSWTVPLSGGDIMIGGGESIGRSERYVASTGKWMEASLVYGVNTTLGIPIPGNKVLITGSDMFVTPRPAEVYDVATNAATPTASPTSMHRYGVGAWLSSTGKALIAGGANDSAVVSTSELWTPSSGTWTATGAMKVGRAEAASVVLPSGRVLAIGGSSVLGDWSALSSVESYDPSTGTWSLVAPMSSRRSQPSAVLLTDGRVLVAGGADNTGAGISTAEIYAPSTDTWTTVAAMGRARPGVTAARLPSGRVLVAGAYPADASVEVYDVTRNVWLPGGSMSAPRSQPSMATLSDGKVLVIGGYSPSLASFSVDVFSEQANGATCAAAGECASGFCVDGRCCDTACNGACQACDVAGNLGKCTSISGAPRSSHPTCAPYATCNAGTCASSCTSDAGCTSTAWCSTGACVSKKANGASCSGANQCVSGSCADGVCCDTACSGQCEACAESGRVGTCSAIAGVPRGARPACSGIAVGGQCGIQCNGIEPKGCVYPPATRSCSAAACADGIESHASTCNGVGLCNDVPKTCGAFACGSVACRTTCSVTSDCASGFVCKSAACVPAPGLGMPCSTSAPCEGGLSCTDGVCCGVSTCGVGKSCALPTSAGRCAKLDGQACAADGECGSGTCVDGVCCESRCGGQCQACDVAGSEGKCVAVKGTPRGARPACAKGSSACEASSCDGSDGSRCAALADTSVSCREASCTDDVATLAASCDGKGTCSAAVTAACAPYRCAGTACATSCIKSDECAKGNDCVDGKCTKSAAQCSSDGVAVLDSEKRRASCLPYKCRDAACLTSCETSDDCATGTVCDGSGVCTTAPTVAAAEEGDGGCAVGQRGTTWSWFGLVALGALVRRRRNKARGIG